MTLPTVGDKVLLLRGRHSGAVGHAVKADRRKNGLYYKIVLLHDRSKSVWVRSDAVRLYWPIARYVVGGPMNGKPATIEIAAGPMYNSEEFFFHAGFGRGEFHRYTHARIPLKKKHLKDLASTLRHMADVIEEYAKNEL